MIQGLLTDSEAAEYLGVNDSSIRRWHQNGQLIPLHIDETTGYRYYSLDQLRAFSLESYQLNDNIDQGERSSFRFIDLFAGIGGFRIAFEDAGGTCVFSSEIDRFACKTYCTNFGDWPEGDITKIVSNDIPEHDILVAGFPCQPFSIAGVSKYESLGWEHGFRHQTKGTLFFDIVRILEHHRPAAFLLENVKNLRSHDNGRTWRVIEQSLKELGYSVFAKVIDAKVVVPQHRERIFIVGFRDGYTFRFPELADHKPKIADILESDVDQKYTLSDRLWEYLQQYAEKHRAAGNGFGYGLVTPDGIARTLSARYYKDGSEILVPQPGRNPRRLTPRECARLMGYDDNYQIPVSDTQAYRQFGNSVVVPVARAVAQVVVETLQEHGGTVTGSEQLVLSGVA